MITQNIDALHEKSGILKEKIIEIHGNATKANCIECGEIANIKLFHAAVENNEEFPICLKCGGLVKVATISFGQSLNMKDFDKAIEALNNLSNESEKHDLFLSLNTHWRFHGKHD